jgi:hypothetical protein
MEGSELDTSYSKLTNHPLPLWVSLPVGHGRHGCVRGRRNFILVELYILDRSIQDAPRQQHTFHAPTDTFKKFPKAKVHHFARWRAAVLQTKRPLIHCHRQSSRQETTHGPPVLRHQRLPSSTQGPYRAPRLPRCCVRGATRHPRKCLHPRAQAWRASARRGTALQPRQTAPGAQRQTGRARTRSAARAAIHWIRSRHGGAPRVGGDRVDVHCVIDTEFVAREA